MAHTDLNRGALELQLVHLLSDINQKYFEYEHLANHMKNKKRKRKYHDLAAGCLLRLAEMKVKLLELAILDQQSKGN